MHRVFLLAGQSNMAGAGVSAELPEAYRSAPSNVRLYEQGQWRDLTWRDRFGPEVGFAHAIAPAFESDPIVLCKVARGGANLYYDWNPDRMEGGPEDDYRGPCYPTLRAAVDEVLDSLDDGHELAGMLWMQGERDSVVGVMAQAYAENLTAFIARVRSDFGEPDLPFLLARIAPRVYDLPVEQFRHAHRALVQESQARVAAADPRCAFVETADLPQSDNLHFDTAGQLLLGRRYAAAYGKSCGGANSEAVAQA